MSVVKLSKPITAHGEEVSELTLREPVTKDVIELGLPQLIIPSDDGPPGIEIRQKVIAAYVMRLAAIPRTSVEQLTLGDFSACQAVVMGFFSQDTDGA